MAGEADRGEALEARVARLERKARELDRLLARIGPKLDEIEGTGRRALEVLAQGGAGMATTDEEAADGQNARSRAPADPGGDRRGA